MLAREADGAFTRGEVPWSMMPLLGSDERMRGYYQRRYRDKNVVSGQLEYRRQLTAARDCRPGRSGNHGALTVVAE